LRRNKNWQQRGMVAFFNRLLSARIGGRERGPGKESSRRRRRSRRCRNTGSRFKRAAGFNVITASDGVAGLRRAREESPVLVILDLMLPKMPGLEVCKILKGDSLTRHIPILMLTAKAEEIDRIVGLELGADDYVSKPFS